MDVWEVGSERVLGPDTEAIFQYLSQAKKKCSLFKRLLAPAVRQQFLALAGDSVGALSRAPKVASSIPGQGTNLSCGFCLWLGHIREATDQCFCFTMLTFFLSHSLTQSHEKTVLG